jgi:DNA gyrase subunit A
MEEENNENIDENPDPETPSEPEKQEDNKPETDDSAPSDEEPKEAFKVVPRLVEEEMKQSYLDYAMSVIVGRALPDVRDGLKPVHRRILYAMNDLGFAHNKPFKKCARIVGEVLGKYHPHGDTAVYDSLVRMAQDFSLRYMLIDGQGNFGSIDGDSAAAMRYTEARLKKIAEETLEDIQKETVDFVDNFDGSLKEPTVLPCKIPNLLINGSSGIAVGMATNVPPHNIKEICAGVIKTVENPNIEVEELFEIVQGPDFPTGGIIQGTAGIKHAYKTGKGRLIVRSRTEIEEKAGKRKLIVTEIPYMVNKSLLLEEIARRVREKTINGISDLRDESDKDGMRIVIELKKDANDEIITNQLFKHTRMQTTFGIHMLALVGNRPESLTLKQMLQAFIFHRKDVIVRRTKFDLRKAQERAHILEGLIIALNDIDRAIALIKKSKSALEARNGLMQTYRLSDKQAQAILDMKLQRLTSMEQDKIKEEHTKLIETIVDLKDILEKDNRVNEIVKNETTEVMEKYGDERRTQIVESNEGEYIEIEDLIKPEDMVVTITHRGYVKRLPVDTYKAQRRGGKGIIATGTKEEDFVEHLFIANTHDYVMFFSNTGKVHWLKVYQIPEGSRQAQGKAIVNLLDTDPKNVINSFVRVKKFEKGKYLLMATKGGIVKKTDLMAYSRPRAGGIRAITLNDNDEVVNVVLTDGNKQIMLATKKGMAVKFHEKNARSIGRTSRGVRGIKLKKDDQVIGMVLANDNKTLLSITENGFGKRSRISDYRLINRGGSGVINIQCSDRNGGVVNIKSVTDDDQVMFISKNGIIIRTACSGMSVIGRNTQGFRLMKLKPDDEVVATAKIVGEEQGEEIKESIEEEEETPENVPN